MSLDFIRLFWLAFYVVQGGLCLWIAFVVFRSRTAAAWIMLVAAILSPLLSLSGQLYYRLSERNLSSGVNRHLDIALALHLGHGVAVLAFLVGVLLHLQRRKLESDRIAELEAILQDLQQNPDAR